jgi:hypothetical protein
MAGLLAAPRLTLAKSGFGFGFVRHLGIFPERLVVLPMFRQAAGPKQCLILSRDMHMGCLSGAGTLKGHAVAARRAPGLSAEMERRNLCLITTKSN